MGGALGVKKLNSATPLIQNHLRTLLMGPMYYIGRDSQAEDQLLREGQHWQALRDGTHDLLRLLLTTRVAPTGNAPSGDILCSLPDPVSTISPRQRSAAPATAPPLGLQQGHKPTRAATPHQRTIDLPQDTSGGAQIHTRLCQ